MMRYLYGPGKKDEHRDQHMVVGYGALPMLYEGALSSKLATDLGKVVEGKWRASYREHLAVAAGGPSKGISSSTLATGGGPDEVGKEHVYHVIASLDPGEGAYTDEQWQTVATEIVQGLGFASSTGDLDGNPWVAVRHGVSSEGCDHIHIAVSLVRADGAWGMPPQYDFAKLQELRRDMEQRHDFITALKDRGYDQGRNGQQLPAYTIGEAAQAAKTARPGQPAVPERVLLQRAVRSAAESSTTEAEFLNAVVANDVQIEAARRGTDGQVSGYKVRLAGDPDARWHTASQLAGDLTLGKLRPRWDAAETDETRQWAGLLWDEQIAPTPVTDVDDPSTPLRQASEHLRVWNTELRNLDQGDAAAWNEQMLRAAGVAATMALPPVFDATAGADVDEQLEGHSPAIDDSPVVDGGRSAVTQAVATVEPVKIEYLLGRGADQLAQVATPRTPGRAAPTLAGPTRAELAARQIVLAMRASSPDTHRGWIAVMQQFSRTLAAIDDAARARGELAAAHRATAQLAVAIDTATTRLQALPFGRPDATVDEADRKPVLSPAAYRAIQGLRHGTPSGRPDLSAGTGSTNFAKPANTTEQERRPRRGLGNGPAKS
nr:hypothetical protein [Rudaeicoccus suwonensis]